MGLIRWLLVGALVAGSAGSAQAALIEFQDVFTPTVAPTLGHQHDLYEFSHSIILQEPGHPGTNVLTTTVDGTVVPGAGYEPGTDTLTQGVLTLFFNTSDTNQGQFDLFLDGQNFIDQQPFAATVTIGAAQFDLGLLTLDGTLTVLIDRRNSSGQVVFTQSILTVEGRRLETNGGPPPNSIPEPASILLFGLGAVAAGHRLRRRG